MSIKKEVKKQEKNLSQEKCTICEQNAEFCMRGLPENTYCRECAQEYFKFLNYLEKL